MSQPTAVVQVLCKAEQLESAANLIAWTVGHRVEIADTTSTADTRWLFVFTDLAYYDDDDTILERLGLDIIGKIGGVLSWEVVPSDRHTSALAAQPTPMILPPQTIEERLIISLSELPVPVSIMKRNSGKYAWKWQEVTGQADTFVDALTSVLTFALRSYKAIVGEIEIAEQNGGNDQSDAALERALMNNLVRLPSPIVIMEASGGIYAWKWGETVGHAETFVDAVTLGLTRAMIAYAEARSRLIES